MRTGEGVIRSVEDWKMYIGDSSNRRLGSHEKIKGGARAGGV